ncbi:MAG: CaiB/BaiF CoA-transferase family protein [Woeseiaceae bacterium]|nr:CaiB/BaiF CoA-transferase family protein [Woeseiaceae bacterium]
MGPLAGIRVIEMKGIGPGPYAGMLLADLGAEVIVVERSTEATGVAPPSHLDIHSRNKKSVVFDVKTSEGLDNLLALVESADVLFEGNRPGVAERLGFGPDVCLSRNPRLIYGRMTGWGQAGPLAHSAGHDINYIALTGALAAIGDRDKPTIPLNLVGDFGGGSLFLVVGILAALLEVRSSGKGQVIDAAITDGTASLMSMFRTMDKLGVWTPERESNLLDGAVPYYNVYKTADAKFISIGSYEPQFYALLIEKAGLDPAVFKDRDNPSRWPDMKARLAAVFVAKTRDEWCEILEGTDVCFAPVLDYREAPDHPHNQARETYIKVGGVTQPAPAPRFSRSECSTPSSPPEIGADTDAILAELRERRTKE